MLQNMGSAQCSNMSLSCNISKQLTDICYDFALSSVCLSETTSLGGGCNECSVVLWQPANTGKCPTHAQLTPAPPPTFPQHLFKMPSKCKCRQIFQFQSPFQLHLIYVDMYNIPSKQNWQVFRLPAFETIIMHQHRWELA